MTISFNDKVISDKNLTLPEVEYLHLICQNINFKELEDSLKEKGFISTKYFNGEPDGIFIMNKTFEIINGIIIESDKENLSVNGDLALRLKSLFPEGRKVGVNKYWTEGVKLIEKRLQTFYKKYGKYSDDDIYNATKRYIDSFNSNYTYMKTLKYFIFKDKVVDGTIESESDLLTFLENKDEEIIQGGWTTKLI